MWMKNVIPRLIYGLEVQNLKKKDILQILQIKTFQRRCIRQLQALPNRTSDTVSLALMGMLPVTVCIEKNILSLFGSVARDQSSNENDLAVRQLTEKKLVLNKCILSEKSMLHTFEDNCSKAMKAQSSKT